MIRSRRIAIAAALPLVFAACGGGSPDQGNSGRAAAVLDDIEAACDNATIDDNASANDVAEAVSDLSDDLADVDTADLDAEARSAVDDFVDTLNDARDEFDDLEGEVEQISYWWDGFAGGDVLSDAETFADDIGVRSCGRFATDYLEATAEDASAPDDTLPDETFPDETLPVETLPAETLPADTLPNESGSTDASAIFDGEFPPVPLPAGLTYVSGPIDLENANLFVEGTSLVDTLAFIQTAAVFDTEGNEIGRVFYGRDPSGEMSAEWYTAWCQGASESLTSPGGAIGTGCTSAGESSFAVPDTLGGAWTVLSFVSAPSAAELADQIIASYGG